VFWGSNSRLAEKIGQFEELKEALALGSEQSSLFFMLHADIMRIVLELPVEDRLELARRLVESLVAPAALNDAVAEGIRRIENVAAERTIGLSEEEFRTVLH